VTLFVWVAGLSNPKSNALIVGAGGGGGGDVNAQRSVASPFARIQKLDVSVRAIAGAGQRQC
jgi:hypothetical protein